MCWPQHRHLFAQLKKKSRALLLSGTTLVRESKDLCWAANAVAKGSAVPTRVKEGFLITFSFVSFPNQENMALSKEAIAESLMPPGRSFLE